MEFGTKPSTQRKAEASQESVMVFVGKKRCGQDNAEWDRRGIESFRRLDRRFGESNTGNTVRDGMGPGRIALLQVLTADVTPDHSLSDDPRGRGGEVVAEEARSESETTDLSYRIANVFEHQWPRVAPCQAGGEDARHGRDSDAERVARANGRRKCLTVEGHRGEGPTGAMNVSKINEGDPWRVGACRPIWRILIADACRDRDAFEYGPVIREELLAVATRIEDTAGCPIEGVICYEQEIQVEPAVE